MYSIFRDPVLRAQFARDGFLTMPFLEEAALVELRALFEEVRGQVSLQGFATTTTSPDLALKQRMYARIAPLYQAKVDAVFQDYKTLGTSFLQKDAGAAGSLPLHQDWTVTEEDRYRTLTIWIPLEDCDVENGALQMLPGSHRWMNLLRGPNLPIAITDIAEELRGDLVTLPLRAGEAVIFDHAILHTSTLNNSGRPRIALTYGLTHRDTPLRFWYYHPGDPPDRFEQLAVPNDFFLRYHQIGKRPDIGQSLGFYRQDLRKLKLQDAELLGAGLALRRAIYRDLSEKKCLLTTPHYPITKNEHWNRELAENGYVILPLLDTGQVEHLKAFFTAHQTAEVNRFYASVHHPDADFRMRMDAEIQRVVGPVLGAILEEGEALGASFIAKPKGNPGILPPHADWNIVDERLWRSYNLWIPLVDTTVENGAVHVIPGSHTWFDYYRGPGIPNPFERWKVEIWKAMVPLEMPAGSALLYDHRLLHASPANQTDELRLACVMGVKPRAAAMRYYHCPARIVWEYAADAGFFLRENPEAGPGGLQLLGEVTDTAVEVSGEELRRFLGVDFTGTVDAPSAPVEKRGFWEVYTLGNIWREIKWRISGK